MRFGHLGKGLRTGGDSSGPRRCWALQPHPSSPSPPCQEAKGRVSFPVAQAPSTRTTVHSGEPVPSLQGSCEAGCQGPLGPEQGQHPGIELTPRGGTGVHGVGFSTGPAPFSGPISSVPRPLPAERSASPPETWPPDPQLLGSQPQWLSCGERLPEDPGKWPTQPDPLLCRSGSLLSAGSPLPFRATGALPGSRPPPRPAPELQDPAVLHFSQRPSQA